MALTSKQRAFLRGQAQHMETIVLIGKDGVTEATAESIKTALAARELVKCKVLDNCPYKAKEAARLKEANRKLEEQQSVKIDYSKIKVSEDNNGLGNINDLLDEI